MERKARFWRGSNINSNEPFFVTELVTLMDGIYREISLQMVLWSTAIVVGLFVEPIDDLLIETV